MPAGNKIISTDDHIRRLTAQTTTYTDYSVVVAMAQTFDANGNRLTLSATINGTADLLDTFTYDNLNRLTTETQQNQSGGHAVTNEGVAFTYDADGNVTGLQCYAVAIASNTSPGFLGHSYDHEDRLALISSGAT